MRWGEKGGAEHAVGYPRVEAPVWRSMFVVRSVYARARAGAKGEHERSRGPVPRIRIVPSFHPDGDRG